MRKARKKRRSWLPLLLLALLLLAGGTYFAATKLFLKEAVPKTTKVSAKAQKQSKKTEASEVQSKISETVTETSESQALAVTLDTSQLTANAANVYYGVYYFKTDQTFSSQNSQPTKSASVIKIFIMAYAFQQINSGQLTLTTLINGDSLENLVNRMIQQSDNQAANSLIDYFGMDQLNLFFQTQGYVNTVLQRRMLDQAASAQGKENYTSLDDCLLFLKRLYQNQTVNPYAEMLKIMQAQGIRTKIPSQLPSGVVVANKTGELAQVENDVGLVFSETNPFAIVVLSDGVTNSEAMRSGIGAFTLAAYND